ncbi:unnamed protein product [Phyllotreta striolata]|uniref:Uncharacterized protein n=1 Tax=Phyllotreta striolata TaxID=444603 RepID=A0A9N9XPJ6_PHYSR|nr:unnamed protein product [Phyllotreta striolata]
MGIRRECNVVSGAPKIRLTKKQIFFHVMIQMVCYLTIPIGTILYIPTMRERRGEIRYGIDVPLIKTSKTTD